MSSQKNQTGQNQACYQPRQNQQVITDQKVKEIVMETLIELDLIPKAQKKKAITNV